MDKALVRLECLKLVHTHAKTSEEILAIAKKYEAYVLEETSKPLEPLAVKKKSQKVVNDNSLFD